MKHEEEKKEVTYKHTLNLPTTDFPIRSNPAVEDKKLLEQWNTEDIYSATFTAHKSSPATYILHDGPPYANGNIHLGHAYNKILKDIVAKSQRMMSAYTPVTPGWDCHGLPIEFKVSQDNPGLSPEELKKACRAYAQHWIETQKEEFKALGVFMDWEHPYLTMDYSYEASILEVFGTFVSEGYIVRKNKTVPWCIHCKTVLATAEIEYAERKDPSLYVLFPLVINDNIKKLLSIGSAPVYILVWTTTPWTLPLNRAVLIKPESTYVALLLEGMYVIVGKGCVEALCATLGVTEHKIMQTFTAEELLNASSGVYHPFEHERIVPLLADHSVSDTDGTAFVHCAPGAGPEDYETGIKNGLDIYSPVAVDGTYTSDILPQDLIGMSILDAQGWVIKELQKSDKLLHKGSLRHSYPHCWRCRNGLIFRATKQWFCDLSKNDLKQRTLEALPSIETLPSNTANRLRTTIDGRLEWCLSRQRVWGVPIPALLCNDCDASYTSQELVDIVAREVRIHGIEWWDTADAAKLVSAHGITCVSCKGASFKKEHDILDVWFDSGVSHYAVLKKNPNLSFPADIYIEGKDQHRGWFQSSLLTSMVLNNTPPMHTILTHGYTVDEQGRKMSKSLGNGITPREIIDKVGTDGLRIWVASVDHSGEVVYSAKVIAHAQEVHRKIRNTCRFLLSNVYDFSPADAIAYRDLGVLDQHAVTRLFVLNQKVQHAYAQYDTAAVFHLLGDYCVIDLSSFYLDIIKDRLYVESAHGRSRRAAQTVCALILDTLTRLMAPILSFTAEHITSFSGTCTHTNDSVSSVHLKTFPLLQDAWDELVHAHASATVRAQINNAFTSESPIRSFAHLDGIELSDEYTSLWNTLSSVRNALLKALEIERAQGNIKHSLEANLTIALDPTKKISTDMAPFYTMLNKQGATPEAFFKELLIVSAVRFAQYDPSLPTSLIDGFAVLVTPAVGTKCPRCWQWEETTNESGLCSRCEPIVKSFTHNE